MLFAYKLLSIILHPLIDIFLISRKLRNKEDSLRFPERIGKYNLKRPKGKLILIHAASVGESKSALTLAKYLLDNNPQINILITSGTVTSAAQISKNLPKRTIHQYVPVDRFLDVQKFIKYWQPNFAIFVESELWPNLITSLKKYGCKMALINGRISDRSFSRWNFLHKIGFNLLENFDICLAQSNIDQKKFSNLGVKNVHFVGNLKAANESLKIDQQQLGKLKEQINDRKLWLASSTHKGEEEMIIKTHQNLKKQFPDLLTIIAIRHPHRLEEVLSLIPSNLKTAIHSHNDSIENCDIYLVDTLGELGTFYSLSKISLICGSLLKGIGGHNPFEALQLGSIVLSGKYVKNFEDIYQNLAESESCILISDEKDLETKLRKMFGDKNYHSSLSKKSENFKNNNEKILENISSKVKDLI
ncbi:MAG: 3-deoxy-D-manno-octulosonic-acid transferase [Lentimonas sp.]